MNRKIRCKFLVTLLAAALLLIPGAAFSPLKAEAASQSEAVAWATAQIGKGLDYDGVYGNQCVDLIKYYYNYFGVANYAMGNANAYITNNLPAGWTRVYSGYQPGDIAVWKTSHSCSTCSTTSYGHVGIITSADATGFNAVNQNFNSQSYCTQNWFYCSALACAIRPSYSTSTAAAKNSVSFADFSQNGVWETNAEMYIKVMNPNKEKVSAVGCYLYDANGSLLKSYSESCSYTTSYVNYNCNINNDMKYTLTGGTTYKFVLYAIVGGKEYKDVTRTFTTTKKAATPTSTPASNQNTQTADGDALVSVAEKEYNTYHGQQYNYQYGTSPWCCNFVSWCARQAGISTDVIKSTATVQTMYDNLINACGAKEVTSPQKGDLVFYKYTDYDSARFHHIGIMISATESIQGNVSNTWWKGKPDALNNIKQIVYVRPAYNGTYVAPSSASFSDYNLNKTEDNNAEVYIKVLNPNRLGVTMVGCELYDADGILLKTYSENCSYTTSYVNYTCNFISDMGYTLSSGTTYKFMLYAVVGGNRINDTMRTFTTTGVKVSNQEQSGTDNYSPSVSDTSSANDTPLANDTPTANDTPAASDTPAAADNGESTPVIKEVPNKIYIVSAVNQKTAKAVIKWKKDTAASWYQVQYSLNKSFKSVKSKKVTAIKCTVSGLKKGKTYYFRVRGYASGAGYGKWSNSKTIKIRR